MTNKIIFIKNYDELENKINKNKILVNLYLSEIEYYKINYGYLFIKKFVNKFISILSENLDENYNIYILGYKEYFITTTNENKSKIEIKINNLINIFKLNNFYIDNINIKYKFKIALSYNTNSNELISKTLNNLNNLNEFYILNNNYKDYLSIKQENNLKIAKIIHNKFIIDNLTTYYQPIINNINNKIEMYECFIRYKDNSISPKDFLPILKKTNLISNVTYTIIKQSFKKLSGTNQKININICIEDLENNKLIKFLKEQQKKYGISNNRINFEIIETFSISNKKIFLIQLKLLKDLGYNIILDNFGYNPSNLKILFELDIDYLKINSYFILRLTEIKYLNIVKGIISLANILNIKVIAEYVENKEIQNIVKKLKIDYSQGFYIGKPSKTIKGLN